MASTCQKTPINEADRINPAENDECALTEEEMVVAVMLVQLAVLAVSGSGGSGGSGGSAAGSGGSSGSGGGGSCGGSNEVRQILSFGSSVCCRPSSSRSCWRFLLFACFIVLLFFLLIFFHLFRFNGRTPRLSPFNTSARVNRPRGNAYQSSNNASSGNAKESVEVTLTVKSNGESNNCGRPNNTTLDFVC
eukprot:GHVS01065407.1.p1 GENE.GHVS01065407.1~~GHVS01065407.1.p1  ORF type:complete len:191 (+),score=68.16 GHVS01065407.1:201-773(+)